MHRFLLVVSLAVAALAATASPSLAGTYTVTSCNASPDHATNNAWVAGTVLATLRITQTCPSSGDRSGLVVTNIPLAGDTATGLGLDWTLTAPAGTTITSITYDRYTGIGADGWNPRLRLSDGTEYDSCTIQFSDNQCSVGSAPAGSGGQITRALGAGITSLNFGVVCAAPGAACSGSGAENFPTAWAALYGSTVTITDSVNPTMGAASGALTNTSGYRRGSVSGTLFATDATGIKATAVYVDGTRYDLTSRTCDNTFAVPCSNLSSGTVSLNSAQISDGSHAVRLAAHDAADNESLTTAVTMTFDNTAPAAPTALAVAGGPSKTTNSFDVSWTNPSGGQVSPLTSVHYRIGSGAEQTVPLTTSLSGLTLPGAGSYPLYVWLDDEAGNSTQANAASTTLTYTAPSSGGGGGSTPATPTAPVTPTQPSTPVTPTQPTTPTTPAVPPSPVATSPVLRLSAPSLKAGTLRVWGTIAKQATGRVTIAYTARVGGRKVTQTSTARLVNGRYTVRLKLRGALAKSKRGTVSVTYAGNASIKRGTTHKTVKRGG